MQRIAKFEKVSFEQFKKDFGKAFPDADVKAVYDALKLPKRATKASAGYDFYAPVAFTLNPQETIKIPTGIRAWMEYGYVLLLAPRSSLGFKYRMQLDNTIGVIDADYYESDNEGHIFIKVTNDSKEAKAFTIQPGEGFAQGIFMAYGITIDDEADAKRNGGFGSTNQ